MSFELVFEKLISHKSPGIDQIPAEMIKVGGRAIGLEIHKLIASIWKKDKLPEEWKETIIVPIQKKGNKTDCNNYRGISLFPTLTKFFQHLSVKVNSICERNYRGSSMWHSTQQVDY